MAKKSIPDSWVTCQNLQEWHDWLLTHHESESEVWLQIKKTGQPDRGFNLSEAVEEAICFGWIDSKMYSLDEEKFILRFSPRKIGSRWSLINRKRAEELMAQGRVTEAGMVPIRAAQANGLWQSAYSSKEAPAIPEDLKEALQADPEAEAHFKTWSNSEKLQAVSWVGLAKQPTTRTNRISRLVALAKQNKKLVQASWRGETT